MKKALLIILALCLAVVITACNGSGRDDVTTTAPDNEDVVTTDFEYIVEPAPAQAELDRYGAGKFLSSTSDDNFVYEYYQDTDGNITVVAAQYIGSDTQVTLPTSFGEQAVTVLGVYAFRANETIAKVTVPAGYKMIGDRAFYQCAALEEISLPAGLETIGTGAFEFCPSLSSLSIPDSVTAVGEQLCYDCTSLKSITLPSSIKEIPAAICYGCTSLSSVTIPAGVTAIGDQAFYYCTSFTSVSLPAGLETIGSGAFYNCHDITSVTLPASVKSVGSYAFFKNSAATSVNLNNGLESIGAYAFYGLDKITEISIPDSVTTIEAGVFGYCDGLTSVTFPSGVKSIGAYVFTHCTNLSEFKFADNITDIGSGAFAYTAITSFEIPDTVKTLGSYAFSNCEKLESVKLSSILTSISASTFRDSTAIKSIALPDTVTTIMDFAFAGCSSLTEVNVGRSVGTIFGKAFYNTAITSLTLPTTLVRINDYAIGYGYAEDEDGVETPALVEGFEIKGFAGNIAETYAGNNDINFVIIGNSGESPYTDFEYEIVPEEEKTVLVSEAYTDEEGNEVEAVYETVKVAEHVIIKKYISTYPTVIVPTTIKVTRTVEEEETTVDINVTGFADGAFTGNTDITAVTVPSHVTAINASLFADCANLKTLTFAGAAVASIGDSAFENCAALTEIAIPSGTAEIGAKAFKDCAALASVTLGTNVESIGDSAFYGCGALEELTLNANLITIGEDALVNTGIMAITIPRKVESIGAHAIGYCYSEDLGYYLVPFKVVTQTVEVDNPNYDPDDPESDEPEKITEEQEVTITFTISFTAGTAGEQYAIDNGYAVTIAI